MRSGCTASGIVVDRAEHRPPLARGPAAWSPGAAATARCRGSRSAETRAGIGRGRRSGSAGETSVSVLTRSGRSAAQPGAHGAAERVADQVHRPAVTLFDQPGHHRGLGAHRVVAIRRGRRVPVAGQVQGLAGDQAPARAARPASIRPVEPVRFVLARCRAGPVQRVHQVGPVPGRTVEAVYAHPGLGSGRRRHGTHEHLRGPDRDQPPWPVRDGRRGPHRKRRWTGTWRPA